MSIPSFPLRPRRRLLPLAWLLLAGLTARADGPLPPAEAARLAAYLDAHGQSPEDYIVGQFARRDVVILGEDHRIRHNLLLAQRLIPLLHRAGVHNFGMEFGASEDQARLDALVTAERYDEDLARKLMFNYNVGWAYREYMDIYRVAWELNRSLPPGARKFRILNLSYKLDWDGFNGVTTPDSMRRVYARGDAERYRAEVVRREILAHHDRILILTGTGHAYTRYALPVNDYLSPGFYRLEDRGMGNHLHRLAPERVCTILLHRPFSSPTGGPDDLIQPAGGAIEQIMAVRGNARVGFDLAGSPLGDIRDDSFYAIGHPDFRLRDLADGYVFEKPFRDYAACTLDEQFLTAENWPEAQRQYPPFPDLGARLKTPEDYHRRVRAYSDIPTIYSRIH